METTKNTTSVETQEDKLILVYYIGIVNPYDGKIVDDVEKYVRDITSRIGVVNTTGLVIPTITTDSRVECINPRYITEPELIRKHRLLMDELHENLQFQIDKLKEENGK
jgi:hypothetical protein